jgi:hypothetical protein
VARLLLLMALRGDDAVPRPQPCRGRAGRHLTAYKGRDAFSCWHFRAAGSRSVRGGPGAGIRFDIFLVRKLGVPGHEELAMGAIASGGVVS